MSSITIWKHADGPNYSTNINKQFAYSEVPYLGDYHLLKIPVSLNNLIQHVDYWGEGKIVTDEGVRGFSNCYNVNRHYQLVSSGPDLDRKIPNRIPVRSEDDCDTSAYIKDNSVVTVTVVGARLSKSCAKDVARVVNNDHGTVVVYGATTDSQGFMELTDELKKKGLFYTYTDTALPTELQGLTYYDSHITDSYRASYYKSHVAFLNTHTLGEIFYNNVVKGKYDTAINTIRYFASGSKNETINDIVARLISTAPRNVMTLAYKLWQDGDSYIVRDHFPRPFQFIFNEENVTIVNKQYRQPLKLDMHTDSNNERLAWGDNNQCKITSERVGWRFRPVWSDEGLTFKLFNLHRNMYLKLDANVDNIGDRQARGSNDSNEDSHKYYLEPYIKNGTLVFFIIHYQYGQGLKLALDKDKIGDRRVWGHNGNVHNEEERFRWVISAW